MPRLQNSFMIAFNNDDTTPGFGERWLRNLYLSIIDQSTLEAYYKKRGYDQVPSNAKLRQLIKNENWSIFGNNRRPYKWITTPFIAIVEAFTNTLAEVTLSINIGLDTWKRKTLKGMSPGTIKSLTAGAFNIAKFFAVGFHTITSSLSFIGHFFNRMTNNFSRNPATSTGATVVGVSASVIVGGTLGLAALLSNPIGWGIILIGGPILLAALASDVYSIYQDRQIDRKVLAADSIAAVLALNIIKHGKKIKTLEAESALEFPTREESLIAQDLKNEREDFDDAAASYNEFIKLVDLPKQDSNLEESLGEAANTKSFEFKKECYGLALKVGDSDRATGIQLLNAIGLTAQPGKTENNLNFSVLASDRLAWIITQIPKNSGKFNVSNYQEKSTQSQNPQSSITVADTNKQHTTAASTHVSAQNELPVDDDDMGLINLFKEPPVIFSTNFIKRPASPAQEGQKVDQLHNEANEIINNSAAAAGSGNENSNNSAKTQTVDDTKKVELN